MNQKRAMESSSPQVSDLPLNQCYVQTRTCIINRTHSFLHSLALLSLFHFRLSHLINFLSQQDTPTTSTKLVIPWLLVFSSELVFSFLWLLCASFGWKLLHRTVYPERLPMSHEKLPSIDVIICTTHPEREPTLVVMNTVLSAMALDYPPEKLNVYLSDDGGFSATLNGLREVSHFAKSWIPFCRVYGITCGCPDAYFSKRPDDDDDDDDDDNDDNLFLNERQNVKKEYELFKARILECKETKHVVNCGTIRDHSSFIEVIEGDTQPLGLPLLAYVAREKRSSHHHHFKAGALNALIRVSGTISNSPYILVLDCDMYCNDPSSAKQSMCFHLDPKISQSLAFVQFPQRFHSITKNDIYDSQLRTAFKALWPGVDGFGGPILAGTGFYIKREAFYHHTSTSSRLDITDLRNIYGPSNEFIRSVHQLKETNNGLHSELGRSLHDVAQGLVSCMYEENTEWGQEVGFMYGSVAEDFFTSMKLHSKGWTSAYLDPLRPQFLGNGVTNLNDFLIQGTRWSSGLIDVALNQMTYKMLSKMSSLPQVMCYSMITYMPLYSIPLWCFATIPQLCLLNGLALYPQVSSSWNFLTFIFIFLSSNLKYLKEVVETGGSIKRWHNETRIWMIKSITGFLYGTLDAILKKIGVREASFMPTNKAIDEDQVKLYHTDKLNFRASEMFVGPLVFVVSLNAMSLIVGSARALVLNELDEMFMQLLICFYVTILSWPVIEAMLIRKDKGSIGLDVTVKWAGLSLGLVMIGSTFARPT